MDSTDAPKTQRCLKHAQEVCRRAFERIDGKKIAALLPTGHSYAAVEQMAMSWEGIRAFIEFIDDPNASILDCGGISTIVLRSVFDKVQTIDQPGYEAYLSYIASLCGDNNGDFTTSWDEVKTADYVLMDYASIEERPKNFAAAWKHAKHAMYVDDCDKRPAFSSLRKAVYDFAESHDIEIADCPEAEDQYGRWGVWLRRNDARHNRSTV